MAEQTGIVCDLYYYRARYYDPMQGRFISQDPIEFLAGDVNFYRYVGGDPVNWVDPSGLYDVVADAIMHPVGHGLPTSELPDSFKVIGDFSDLVQGKIKLGKFKDNLIDIIKENLNPFGKKGKKKRPKKKEVPKKDNGETVKDNKKKKCDKKARTKETRHRPKYKTGQVENVWNTAKKKSRDGKVRDPHTKEVLNWDKTKSRFNQWHMGHKPGKSYKSLRNKYINCKISKEKYLEEYKNEKNYYPEDPHENMSGKHDTN